MEKVLAGRYVLGEELGRGGMGRVVAAHDRRLGRAVAVKLLRLDTGGPDDLIARERFVREGRSAAAFSHPHAVAVYDAGDADGLLYLVMEMVDGESLARLLAERGSLGIEEAVGITDQVLQALGAAHRAGIVHRDVKPSNVLVSRAGVAKLADFGIAQRLDDLTGGLTRTGQVLGTPTYLAPEQVIGERAGPASDLYATGVVLYEMLTGTPPFVARSPLATALAHREVPVPDVRQHRREVPDHVAAALRTAMAKDPIQRFTTADDMRAALNFPSAAPSLQLVALTSAPTIQAPAATAVMPTAHRQRRAWWWIALAAAMVATVGVIVAGRGDGDTPRGADPAASATPTVPPTDPAATPTTALTPPTTPSTTPDTPARPAPTTTVVAVSSLEGLIVLLGSDPDRFGTHADALTRDLSKILERDGAQRARDVERLRSRLDDWTADGTMTPAAAALVRSVLGDLSPVDS